MRDKILSRAVVVFTAGLFTVGPALAQPAATPDAPSDGAATSSPATPESKAPPAARASEGRTGRPNATLDERIQAMHQRLQITPQQENAWSAFAQVMRDNASAVERDYQQRANGIGGMNAMDNLRDYSRIEADRAKGVQRLSAAFDPLYGQLSDPQKKRADMMFRHYDPQDRPGRHASKARPHPTTAADQAR